MVWPRNARRMKTIQAESPVGIGSAACSQQGSTRRRTGGKAVELWTNKRPQNSGCSQGTGCGVPERSNGPTACSKSKRHIASAGGKSTEHPAPFKTASLTGATEQIGRVLLVHFSVRRWLTLADRKESYAAQSITAIPIPGKSQDPSRSQTMKRPLRSRGLPELPGLFLVSTHPHCVEACQAPALPGPSRRFSNQLNKQVCKNLKVELGPQSAYLGCSRRRRGERCFPLRIGYQAAALQVPRPRSGHFHACPPFSVRLFFRADSL